MSFPPFLALEASSLGFCQQGTTGAHVDKRWRVKLSTGQNRMSEDPAANHIHLYKSEEGEQSNFVSSTEMKNEENAVLFSARIYLQCTSA